METFSQCMCISDINSINNLNNLFYFFRVVSNPIEIYNITHKSFWTHWNQRLWIFHTNETNYNHRIGILCIQFVCYVYKMIWVLSLESWIRIQNSFIQRMALLTKWNIFCFYFYFFCSLSVHTQILNQMHATNMFSHNHLTVVRFVVYNIFFSSFRWIKTLKC